MKNLFEVDIRSLALFRVCIGSLVFVDILSRICDLEAFYSDFGVLPRTLYLSFYQNWHFSLCLLHGSLGWQCILAILTLCFAVLLVVGYRTRLAAFAIWILMLSFNARNPLILNGGDVLFLILLFWGMFLPLNACYSIDSALNTGDKPPKKIISGGTCGILLQGFFLYFFTGLFKISPEWVQEGSAIYYALSMDQYVKPIGKLLLNFPFMLKYLTFGILYFEIIGALLLFSPVFTAFFRMVIIFCVLCMHIGFGLILDVGYFPFAGTFAIIAFLPSGFWDKITFSLKTNERLGLKIYYDGDCGFCKKLVYIIKEFFLIPEVVLTTTQSDKAIYEDMQKHNSWVVVDYKGNKHFKFDALVYVLSVSPLIYPLTFILKWTPIKLLGKFLYEMVAANRKLASYFTKPFSFHLLKFKPLFVTNLLAVFFTVYILLLNIESLPFAQFKIPQYGKWIGYIVNVNQKWSMFGADYIKFDGWHVIQGVVKSGKQINVLNENQILTFDKPDDVLCIYKNKRWKAYMRNVFLPDYKYLINGYLRYLCTNWNKTHFDNNALKYFYVYFMNEQSKFDIKVSEVKKHLLYSYSCD
ncbi:MAG: HTTM domain-containing protein [Candidatus Melainabacteria bacterium]|nr:HTTM domain-containing protein [Candidatus Melainabacteria bacterium]